MKPGVFFNGIGRQVFEPFIDIVSITCANIIEFAWRGALWLFTKAQTPDKFTVGG